MPVIDIRDLTKRYRKGVLANDGITLAVESGEIYGLLGPNGAGKTTLVRQLLGLLKPTSGGITVDGVDVVAHPGYARQAVGSLPQSQVNMFGLKLREWVYGVARLRGIDATEANRRTEEVIDRLELQEFAGTQMNAASGGVRRLAGFAASIVSQPRVLVLDEPTNDVDPVRRQVLWRTIGDLGRSGATILLVTHNLAEAERYIDRLAIIDNGRILREGSPASMRSLVTDSLRLHLQPNNVQAHPALSADPLEPGAYLFERRDLSPVVGWLETLRESGQLEDFRIGPPSLDDIYTAVVTGQANRTMEPAL
jgi:ABC-2 type transport system ATP-binding protein